MTALIAVLAFIAALGPLIVFHELGHYWVARWFNVRVLRFSVGFGKPLFKIVRGPDKTEWTIGAIPFGGFVAMLDEREIEGVSSYSESELKRAFNRQSVWARMAIVVAGPVANFIAAIVVYTMVYLYGVAEPRAIVAEPAPQSIAARAGVHGGDEITAVDGHLVPSLVSARFRLIQDAVDAQNALLTLHSASGGVRDVTLDFSGMTPSAIEGDLMGSTGLLLQLPPPVIESVTPKSPAAQGGLQPQDRILAVDGTPVSEVEPFVKLIRKAPGRALVLHVARGNSLLDLKVTPESHQEGDQPANGSIGVSLQGPAMARVQYGVIDSVDHALHQTYDMTALSARMLVKMVQGQISLKNLSGPITIADYAGQSARLGLGIFLGLIAFISINLGLMNLMPIPMLDGGHLLYYCVEIIQGRPPSDRFLEMSQRAGMAVLACLMSVALFNDFSRLLS
jgi:regulator of sigma E protease